ncbi:hypothetical protein FG93_05243 [Bosea sp. LC85]|uniref:hypothetical protein n=1 Tax=Bosea sp. LC85 TaxID=1502851 RepID=UPI0004E3E10A|nr:hypothetical protein [Bosea sp. LC85]KFC64647.1 hypothetical protein FG93_05243 [Bosea sp. LC85]
MAADPVKPRRTGAKNRKQDMSESAEDIGGGIGELANSAGEAVDEAAFVTDRFVDIASERAAGLQQRIIDEIREKPLQAVGFAAMIGLFVGFSVAR